MHRHIITKAKMIEWLRDQWWQYAASCSADDLSNKQFEISWAGLHRVTDHGKVVYEGPNPDAAIKAYNACP